MLSGLLKIAAISATGFYRCGRYFPQGGVVAQASDFTEDELKRLAEEPMLRITAASDDDAENAEIRAEKIADAIRTLGSEDFQKDGKPKVEALNVLLGDELGKVTATERNTIWGLLIDEGFKPSSTEA